MKDAILDYVKNEYLDEEDLEDMDLDENTPLISSGIVDSFSMVSLKLFLETKYSIKIADDQGIETLVLFCPRNDTEYRVVASMPDRQRAEEIQDELARLLLADGT